MIQYIIAAGIGAFLGSQSKKSKKSYAHGGYVMDDYTLTLKPDSTIINEVYKGKYDDDTLDMSESFNRTWSIKQEQYDKLKSNKPITIEGGNVSWEWRFTVTRDMVEKVEKRTITKKEVKFAKGGKVELHKHPQGHWMLINPLSFQVGEDFVNEQDAKDYAWNNGIELTNSSYAHGGEVDDLEYSEIYDVLKDKIDDAVEDISSTYDQANDSNGEEVESKSRDGFIPYTNGGYSSKWFEYINMLSGSGASLPTSVLDKEMQRQVDYSYELAKDRFVEENEELVKEIGEDKVNYHDLYELGYGDEAESLSEMESDMGDDSILMQVEAMYYAPHNDRGIDGKNTIRLSGSVNLEAPYHRRGNLDDYIETEFTFNSVEELETKMDSNLKKVIGWFEGDNYSESKRELKIRRMAKGGKTVKRYIVYKGDDYDGEVVGSSDTFRGARMIRTRLEKKGVFKDVDTYGISDTENYTYIRKDNKFAKGGKTDEYVAITLKPKKSAYRGGKGEVYKSMQNFYDTINTTDNKDKYEFIHSIFISDSRKSDPKDISEIKVYMIGEKSGFDDVEKRGLYDLFDLVKTKEEVKDYAKGGKTRKKVKK